MAAQILLACVPRRDGLEFLRGEHWEKQLWKSSLPGQRLGFVQREFKHVTVLLQILTTLNQQSGFDGLDLRQQLSAGSQTSVSEGGLTAERAGLDRSW